jgi:hypothetical protein
MADIERGKFSTNYVRMVRAATLQFDARSGFPVAALFQPAFVVFRHFGFRAAGASRMQASFAPTIAINDDGGISSA